MRVTNNFSKNIGFGQAQVNIMATSDNHGKLDSLPDMLDTIIKHKKEVFPSAAALDIKNPESVKNIGAFNGDWFMNPGKGHYLTFHDKRAGDFQLLFLKKFVEQLKKPLKQNFEAIVSVGNHCLDGGDKLYLELATKRGNNFTPVLSNANFESSPAIINLTANQQKRIKKAVVVEVPDDKKPDLKHKMLVLGVTIMGVDFYNPGIVNGIDFIDRTTKKDSKIQSEDIQNTYEELNKVIGEFKEENPKGAVMVMAHTGNKISKFIASNVKGIDLILNGHDHKDTQEVFTTETGREVPIISLGDDNKFFSSIHLNFDDDGNSKIDYKKIDTKKSPDSENNMLGKLVEHYFRKDKIPYLFISGDEQNILSQKGVRKENNLLANFVTDGIVEGIRKYVPDVQVFCVASSAFRHDLNLGNKGNNNLALRNLLSGQTDDLSVIHVAKVKGADIVSMVVENLDDHKKDMDRNTILQWSGLQVNKTEIIKALESGETKHSENIASFIKIKNKQEEYEPIDLDGKYKMAIPSYFFKRPKLPTAQKLEPEFVSIKRTMDGLFREYLTDNNLELNPPNPKDIRIK